MSGSVLLPADSVSVVIPTHNRLDLTRVCLEALAATATPPLKEIVVVDNGSTDGTASFLVSAAEQGRLRAVLNDENQGFARACNQGAAAARGDYVFFLNNDTVVQEGWLEPLLRTLALDPQVAAVGPKLLYPDGTIQHAGVVVVEAARPEGRILEGRHRGVRKPGDWAGADTPQTFQALTAAALMVRKACFAAVDGFDDAYWNGNEDLDLCFKLGIRGGLLVYRPESVIVHAESQSGPERWTRVTENVKLLTRRWTGRIMPDLSIRESGEAVASGANAVRPYVEPRLVDRRERTPGTASVIVLTYNALEYTRRCVDSLLLHTDPRHELLFVDNASDDGTRGFLRDLAAREPRCRCLLNDENLGFAGGNNVGLATARGEHVVLLNSDVVVTPDWLEHLLAVLAREPDAGLVGPVTNEISGLQKLATVDYHEESLNGLDAFAEHLAATRAGETEPSLRLVGFCLLIRRELLQRIGGLDTVFGRGNFEDNDYCLRALLAGYRALVAHDCFIHHFGSRSFAAAGIDYRDQITGKWDIFKRKWGIPDEVGYNQPFDATAALGHGFHPALHTCGLPQNEQLRVLVPPAWERDRWIVAGERLYADGRLHDAERIFRAVLAHDPDDERATNDLAVTLWQAGEADAADEAVALLEALVARCPAAEDALWNLQEFRKEMALAAAKPTGVESPAAESLAIR